MKRWQRWLTRVAILWGWVCFGLFVAAAAEGESGDLFVYLFLVVFAGPPILAFVALAARESWRVWKGVGE